MANETRNLIIGAIIIWLVMGQGGTTTAPATTTTNDNVEQCAYAPTVQLAASNEYVSSTTDFGTWKYKLNGGGTSTDADGNFEVQKGSGLTVLVADSNSSTYYKSIWSPTISHCGLNSLNYPEVVEATAYEAKCFNDDGNPMNGTTYTNNLTIGTEGTRSIKCELTGVAKKGVPHGGVMIAEFNQSTYERDVLSLQWNGADASGVTTPGAYAVGVAGATTRTWEIPSFEGPSTIPFYLNSIKAKSGINPGIIETPTTTDYGDGILLRLYPKNCYEEEDVTPSEFRCGYEDLDNTFVAPGGTAKASAQIAEFLIGVD